MRFILGHAGNLQRRDRLTDDLWEVRDLGYETPCWIAKFAPRTAAGYTHASIGGHRRLTHRVMYEQEVGPIPEGLVIDHLCRQPACINPAHLEPVTHAENIRRGNNAKLTAADADLIRQSSLSARKIAKLYGVAPATIDDIRAGRSWT